VEACGKEDGEDGGCSATVALELGCTLAGQWRFPAAPHHLVIIKDVHRDTTSIEMANHPGFSRLDKLVTLMAVSHRSQRPDRGLADVGQSSNAIERRALRNGNWWHHEQRFCPLWRVAHCYS
jgi:hypothetical protein